MMSLKIIDGLFAISVVASLVIGIRRARLNTSASPEERWIQALLPVAIVTSVALLFQALLRAPFWEFSSGRLAPLIGLKYGYALYYPLNSGPLYVTQYGPMAFLSYAPALLGKTPLQTILLGTATAMTLFFGPMIALAWTRSTRQPVRAASWWVAAALFILFTWQSAPLAYCAFTVHADAPELGLGAAAAMLLYRRTRGASSRSLAWPALLSCLAVWAKPTAFPGLVAGALFLLITENRIVTAHYVGWLIGWGLSLSALFIGIFGWHPLIDNVFVLTAHFPFMRTSNGVPGAVLGQLPFLLKESALPLFVLILVLSDVRTPCRDLFKSERWTLFALIALFMVPVAIVHKALVAADVNALADSVYYLALAVVIALAHRNNLTTLRILFAAAGVLTLVALPTLTRLSIDAGHLRHNPRSDAFAFARAHPGEVYFPLDPLATLMADGRLYHYEVALFDADLLHWTIGQEQWTAYIPNHMRYLAYEAHNQFSRKLFPTFTQTIDQPTLPGWTVYVPTSESPEAATQSPK